jgi:hypothetical protein
MVCKQAHHQNAGYSTITKVPEAMKISEKYRKSRGYYKEITSFWNVNSLNASESRAPTLPVPTEY